MDYVPLGSAGLKVSRICLGMMSYGSTAERAWHLSETEAEPLVKAAADGGVIFFDTADVYSAGFSEEITGRVLRRVFGHRDDYVLATKVYFATGNGPNDGGLSRKRIMSAIDASLRRLGTDYVTAADFDVAARVAQVAAARGVPPAQIALAWLLHKPAVTAPIIGATKLRHIEDALAATDLTLTGEEIGRLEEPYIPHPVLGHS